MEKTYFNRPEYSARFPEIAADILLAGSYDRRDRVVRGDNNQMSHPNKEIVYDKRHDVEMASKSA